MCETQQQLVCLSSNYPKKSRLNPCCRFQSLPLSVVFFNLSIGAVSTRFKVAGVNPFFEDQTNGKSPLDVGRLL